MQTQPLPLSDRLSTLLKSLGEEKSFEPREVITRIGEPSQFVAFIKEGELSVYDRHGAALARLKPGDLFGELGYLLRRPRLAELTAVRSGKYLKIDYGTLERWVAENPEEGRDFHLWLSQRLAVRLSSLAHDTRRYIALVAHDRMKAKLCEFAKRHRELLARFDLAATATTAKHLFEQVDLTVSRSVASGPLGGDLAIGSLITTGNIEAVFFFKDPLTAQAHQADIEALSRLCDVHDIPIATNPASAENLLRGLVSKR